MQTTENPVYTSDFGAAFAPPKNGWAVSQVQSFAGSKSRTGARTPNYFRLKASNAILPVNPLLEEVRMYDITDGSMEALHTDGKTWYSMHGNIPLHTTLKNVVPKWSSLPVIPPVSATRINDLAVTALSDARQEMFDSLTFLAELDKTIDLFKSCVNRYTQRALVVDKKARIIYKTMKRGSFAPTSSASAMAVFSATWLEYRYGWTPLAFEMEALYAQYLELSALFHRIRGSSSETTPTVLSSSVSSGTGFITPEKVGSGGWLWRVKRSSVQEVTIKSKCLLELPSSFRTSGDPLMTAYEVIPYTWIADWFFTIGESIRAFSPFQQGELKACSVTTLLSGSLVFESVRPEDTAFVKLKSFEASRFEMKVGQKHRFAYQPEFDLSFRVELNLKRIADAVSLVLIRLARHLVSIPRESLSNWRHLYA